MNLRSFRLELQAVIIARREFLNGCLGAAIVRLATPHKRAGRDAGGTGAR